ncbi:hypothetical protein NC651_008109 [Populus alba x Populus x berolinensis]|nr:hypothetical protein NC651_008109 [Populus alba x Populus x berolinensis]
MWMWTPRKTGTGLHPQDFLDSSFCFDVQVTFSLMYLNLMMSEEEANERSAHEYVQRKEKISYQSMETKQVRS